MMMMGLKSIDNDNKKLKRKGFSSVKMDEWTMVDVFSKLNLDTIHHKCHSKIMEMKKLLFLFVFENLKIQFK